jgi:DNA modification methylase
VTISILQGDCRQVLHGLPQASIGCCVTSPPYFGLRDYGHAQQIGLEATPEAYVAELVAVFREVRRVLREDGTLWINIGDTYAGDRGAQGANNRGQTDSRRRDHTPIPRSDGRYPGYKPKDLIGIPWMLAFALRADGWFLRQEIIWAKAQSGEDRGGSVMPESVADRCTKAHEQVFLLSKAPTYYFDAAAIAEPVLTMERDVARARQPGRGRRAAAAHSLGPPQRDHSGGYFAGATANRRSVWRINTVPFHGAHFATMPPALVELCLRAGLRERDTVLDPFSGAGTTGLVADRLHRDAVLIELNLDYVDLMRRRIAADAPLFAQICASVESAYRD